MRFSRQEYWSGLPCPPQGDLPDPGNEPRSPALHADSLPSEPPVKPQSDIYRSECKTGCRFYSQIFAKYLLLKIAFSISYWCVTSNPNNHQLKTTVIYYYVLVSAAWLKFSRPRFGSAGELCISLQVCRLAGSAIFRESLLLGQVALLLTMMIRAQKEETLKDCLGLDLELMQSVVYIPLAKASHMCSRFSMTISYFSLLPSRGSLFYTDIPHLYGTPLQYSCLENPMDRGAW